MHPKMTTWEDGTRKWYLNGIQHREDGPAVIYANGNEAWWINGEELFEDEIWALKFKIQIAEAIK